MHGSIMWVWPQGMCQRDNGGHSGSAPELVVLGVVVACDVVDERHLSPQVGAQTLQQPAAIVPVHIRAKQEMRTRRLPASDE